MRKFITFFIFCIPIFSCNSQEDNGQELVDQFFETYTSNSPIEALNFAFGTNKWMKGDSENLVNVKNQLEEMIKLIGDYIGKEQIASKQIGERYRLVSYFVYYERQPLRFTFQLYKNSEGWMLWNFEFDADYDAEIKESAKISNID